MTSTTNNNATPMWRPNIVQSFMSGGLAGAASGFACLPFDQFITKLQIREGPCHYTIFAEVSKRPFLGGTVVIPSTVAKNALVLGTLPLYRGLFEEAGLSREQAEKPAGAVAGMTNAVVMNRLNTMKVFMQTETGTEKRTIAEIWRNLPKAGAAATIARETIYWPVFLTLSRGLRDKMVDVVGVDYIRQTDAVSGFVGGAAAAVLSYPFDTIAKVQKKVTPKDNMLTVAKRLHATGGVRSFFKGVNFAQARMGVCGLVVMTTKEIVYDFFKERDDVKS